jgi:TPR repeat protein
MDGRMSAQLFLGLRYYLGKDCARDFNEAVKWLEMAAMQGSETAQMCLAMIYGTGECVKYGMSPDRRLAYAWAEIASTKLPEAARIAEDLMRNKPKFVRQSAMKISDDLKRRIRQAAIEP